IFYLQAEDGIRDRNVTGVQTCALPISEIIRLSATIKSCDKYFNHVLVHTGQNYDYTLNQVFFEDLELRKPDYFLEVVGSHLGERSEERRVGKEGISQGESVN